ncbi:MAG: hypothetical protein JW908_15760 [Anaerolineales bacterium]|nr:hypothetical protein [Anaerolineales bacterium]
MEYRNPPIFGRVIWIFVIASMILMGCGQKETPKPTMAIPTATVGQLANISTPETTPVVVTSTEAPVEEIPPSPTIPPPTSEPTATTAEVIPPTETVAPAPAGMSLMDWTLWGWTSSTSPMACQDSNSACWMLVNYREATSLVYAKKITIDPGWKTPTLVFQNRYSIKESKAFGFVEIEVQGEVGWNRVYSLKGSRDYWHEVAIDLSEFSGKTITLRFATRPYFEIVQKGEATKMVYNKQTWIIQNVAIVSNY